MAAFRLSCRGAILSVLIAAVTTPVAGQSTTPVCGYSVIASFPHDSDAWTQGLVIRSGILYEGTGLYGESSIRRVDLETGAVEQQQNLSSSYFGEGVTLWEDRLIQLTWQEQTAFLWDRSTFAPLGQFSYTGEGWGLTDGAGRLIMSDGSAVITYRNAQTFASISQISVHDGPDDVTHLNELEFIRGEILANVWLTDRIVRIRPDTGEVLAWIDLTGLLPSGTDADVLNGIAWNDDEERLFVTGKLWPTLYEIELTGCPPIPLFADGFASGNTLGWSTTTP